jgi:hypothetical protein
MYAVLFSLAFSFANANTGEFKAIAGIEKSVTCGFAKNLVKFDGLAPQYALYDANTKVTKLNRCTTAQLSDLTFYTVEFESEIMQGRELFKVLSLEVALFDPKLNSIKPVRSEIIDQISQSGDAVNTKFTTKGTLAWGKSSKDGQIMLKLDMTEANEKPFSYLLKLNKKKNWFENIF